MANNQKILVVDDEPDIVELISYHLTKEGYQVHTASNGKEAIKTAKEVFPDLIILDVMMPEMDGIEACRLMRSMPEFKHIFMVFLTARSEEYSEIAGFHVGADDYIAKPFEPKELIARVKAVLRRTSHTSSSKASESQQNNDDLISYPDLEINRTQYLVRLRDEELSLPPKELELLYFLASHPNRVFTRSQILENIWGFDYYGEPRTVDVHIKRLRQKLDVIDHPFWNIKTIWSVGYKFEVKN